jgi:hypothetical protein
VAGIEEKAVLHVEGQDFDLGTKSTTAFGVIGGGGLDFRVSPTGVIGVEYQMQRIFVSPHNWTLSLPTARFAYLF